MAKWLIVILIFAAFLRLVFLNEIPPGPNFDEIQVILTAQSLAQSGESIPGTVTGIFGKSQGNFQTGVFSDIGSYLLVPWVKFFGVDWPFIKIPFILTSLGMIVMVFLITKKLVNEKIGLVAAFLFSINPWSVHLGRTAYESLFSYFFYLLAVFIFISFEGKKLLLALPPLILGFLSYFGAKPQFPPLVAAGIFFNSLLNPKSSKRNLKFYKVIGIVCVIFFLVYGLFFLQTPSSLRVNETKTNLSISESVDIKRRASISSPLNKLAENKLTLQLRERIGGYIGALSPIFLFLDGPTWGAESLIITDHGPMYLIDFLLISVGLIALSKFNTKALIIIASGILISLIPNAVSLSAKNYIVRTGLLYPFLTILVSCGVWFFTTYPKTKILRGSFLIILSFVYLISFSIFLNQYFFRTPVDKSEGWNLQNRILAKYIKLENSLNPGQTHTVVINDFNGISYTYLLFSGSYNTSSQVRSVNKILKNESYDFGNIKFVSKCPDSLAENETLISEPRFNCLPTQKFHSQIASPKDNGGKYLIFSDELCNGGQNRYPIVRKVDDLNIEAMSKDEFCSKWITNPDKTS